MNNFSLEACLFLALIASVSEKEVPELVASIFCKSD